MADDVTRLLAAFSQGRDGAVDKLFPIVYGELRNLASSLLNGERHDHTLQTTALVHEAYLKLVDQRATQWNDRVHFLAIAAQAMRRVLVDYAKARNRDKRSGKWIRMPLDGETGLTIDLGSGTIDLIDLDEALTQLSQIRPRAERVVEMQYFGGLSTDDIALMLKVSGRTVEREWRYARAWLRDELEGDAE